ncbi:3-oxoacyl-[acyl-carrier-protein] reductase [Bacillus sp. FJAT-44742]|uniref:3-oxoacyl-[acyl-carrier-protein] reductase n=1 Tax=Bacillus sp. FJAT-44742 TaxID=2014005 RepID=UPI000C232731|nr:3-oxoacyl-[acyl-carrier-protein] reductase [Bacillus sp. FJAT-44742]
MRVSDKVAVITGGARGIGAATALRFVEEGAAVVILDMNEEEIHKTVKELKAKGGTAVGKTVDVTIEKEVELAFKEIYEEFKRIDVVINNAGITADAQLLKMKEEEWEKVINVNLKGVFLVGKTAASYMKEKESGVILNASSVVGIYGNFGQTNYAATKAGVNGLTKSWAKELGRYNIRVNAVAPGFILTPMTEKMPEKVLTVMKEKSPLQTLGTSEDIANAYLFLASNEARFITGTVLSVDGGVVI